MQPAAEVNFTTKEQGKIQSGGKCKELWAVGSPPLSGLSAPSTCSWGSPGAETGIFRLLPPLSFEGRDAAGLGSWGCPDSGSCHTGWVAKTTWEMYILTVLEARSPKSGRLQGRGPSRPEDRMRPHLSQPWEPRVPRVPRAPVFVDASLQSLSQPPHDLLSLSLCVPMSFVLQRHHSHRCRARPNACIFIYCHLQRPGFA